MRAPHAQSAAAGGRRTLAPARPCVQHTRPPLLRPNPPTPAPSPQSGRLPSSCGRHEQNHGRQLPQPGSACRGAIQRRAPGVHRPSMQRPMQRCGPSACGARARAQVCGAVAAGPCACCACMPASSAKAARRRRVGLLCTPMHPASPPRAPQSRCRMRLGHRRCRRRSTTAARCPLTAAAGAPGAPSALGSPRTRLAALPARSNPCLQARGRRVLSRTCMLSRGAARSMQPPHAHRMRPDCTAQALPLGPALIRAGCLPTTTSRRAG